MAARKTTLDIFIPEDRRQALTQGGSLPTRSFGAVMFADVSGFTRLTGMFSKELGPRRGAEALAQVLDPIYAELVNAIHSYRGSVIVISGDGITSWFDQDDGPRAMACAFTMQGIMLQYGGISIPGGQKTSLGIKIALSVGAVQRFLVGDPAIQLLEALAGREVDQVVSIHDALEKGDVAIGIDLLQKFGQSLSVITERQTADGALFAIVEEQAKLAEPNPWPAIPALNDEVARRWVHRSVYNRIEGEEIEFLTELRQAVPLFVKFTGIDYDQDEHAGEKLDQFVRCVQSVLERYEGYLCQLTIGGKGTNTFIAFGAPIAHEDNVDRALAAALRLKAATADLGFIRPIQIGLTRGQLWAGAHGGRAARTYSVIGSEVNLAHRLMSHTEPGQILVSPHVAETAPHYSFAQLPPINFKGVEKPMTPYLLLGRTRLQGGVSNQDFMFGRVTERGILIMKLSELISSDPADAAGIVIIEGEAGIGKSRLLADFMEQANQRGVRVLYGEGDPIESGTQYYAFRRILESIFNLAEVEDSQQARERILTAIEGDKFLLERAPLLGEILPLQWRDNELTSQMIGEARAESIREVVLGVLRNARSGQEPPVPMIIVVDDAHWLDYATWTLIGYMVGELPATLFVISMRPLAEEQVGTETAKAYLELRDNPATQRFQLSSLSLEDASHLIEQRLGVKSLPTFVLEFIRVRSQGNPFFTEQVAYALRDAGIIRISDGEAVVDFGADEFQRIDFPATVQGIITSRIDRLSPSQQLTLKVASVVGRVFLLKILDSVHPSKIGMDVLLDQLSALTRLGITDLEDVSPEYSYLFRHVITQEVIYGLLTFAQRRQLHCAIAEWYEKNHLEDQSAYYSRLAHHWLNGEVTEKAIEFLDKAGEQALELYSNEDVVRFISTAIELDEQTQGKAFDLKLNLQRVIRRARWERMLGTANLNLGRLEESLLHQKGALRLLGHPIPETKSLIILSLLKEILLQSLYRFRGNAWRDKSGTVSWQIDMELAQIDPGGVLYYSQNVTLLAWAILFRLNAAERVHLSAARAAGYSGLLLIAGFVQNQRLTALYRRLASEAVKEADRISMRIRNLLINGVVYFTNCEWDRAGENFDIGMRLADQIGDFREYANLGASKASSLFLQGKYQDSVHLWKDMHQRMAKRDTIQTPAWALFGQGANQLMLGQIDEALSNLEASLTLLKKSAEDKILDTSLYGTLSLAYLRKGQFALALANVIVHDKNTNTPSPSSIVNYYSAIIDATLELYGGLLTQKINFTDAEAAHVKQLLGRIPKYLNALKNLPTNKAGVYLYKGIYARLTGKQEEALKDWKKSIEFSRGFNQPYELARASLELGQHVSLDASGRGEYLAEACAIFESLGTTFELNLARAALAELTNASTG
ncbi:MAG TPA: AAA family ATPase [Anaerolineales bacterium]|nr:AAA family ATPase [Anaerolineales bacterium]